MGYKGTITAVHTINDPNPVRLESVRKTDVLYEVLFDKPFDEGNSVENVAEKRFFNVPPMHLINITQGLQKSYSIIKSSENAQRTITVDKNKIWEQLRKNIDDKKLGTTTTNEVEEESKNFVVKQQTTNKISTEGTDKSDILRKLLKIENKHNEPAVIQNGSYENSTKINVSDLFRVDTMNLPKPPQNWHTEKINPNKVVPGTMTNHNKGNHQFNAQPTLKPYIHHPQPNNVGHLSPIGNTTNKYINNQVS